MPPLWPVCLMASRKKCTSYWCISISWSELKFYASPPFSLIGAAIAKVKEKCLGIMIIPWWKTQFWFPMMVSLLKNFLILLPSNILTDFTIQKISKTPTLSENEIISSSLIRESFRNKNLPREIRDVITDSWRTTTQSQYESVLSSHDLFMKVQGTEIPVLQM